MRRNTLAMTLTAATLAVVAVIVRPVHGQVPNGDVVTALLVEVRGLRAAIEQLASSNARIQLAIGRLQIQEQRVNALLRQQMEVRQRLLEAERVHAEGEARLADMSDIVGAVQEPGERQAIVQEIGVLKMTVAAGITALQKMRSDDADLAGLVSTEQGRWNAINEELDSLNRALR